tara:strand:+ start:220 stop:483 length:264 start_codon:yes stop_codon:yes gene_type:complete
MKPKFSIIIPTTIPKLMKNALESQLNQDFPVNNFEVIISDNSPKHVKNFLTGKYRNKNLKYRRPAKYLTVYEGWKFGFSKKPEWIGL